MNVKLVYALAAVLIGIAVYMLVGGTEPSPPPPGRDAFGDPLPSWAVARLGRFVAAPVREPFVVSADGKTVTAAIGDGEIGTVSVATGSARGSPVTRVTSGGWSSPRTVVGWHRAARTGRCWSGM